MDPPLKPVVSQKDYLKKYFSKSSKADKAKKKKVKLSSSSHLKRSQIIDDDLNLNSIADIDDDHFNLSYLGDEAPQVAGIIDERPDSIKALEAYGDTKKWKSISDEPVNSLNDFYSNPFGKQDNLQNNIRTKQDKSIEDEKIDVRLKKNSKSLNKNGNYEKQDYQEDSSPMRKINPEYSVSHSIRNAERDVSRKEKSQSSRGNIGPDDRRERKDFNKDKSPPRRNNDRRQHQNLDSNQSPPRRNLGMDSRRPRQNFDRSPLKKTSVKDSKKQRNDSDSDQSPTSKPSGRDGRKQMNDSDSDQTPPRKTSGRDVRKRRNYSDSDQSPPRKTSVRDSRKQRNDSDSDQPPPRKFSGRDSRRQRNNSDDNPSPLRTTFGRDSRRQRQDSGSDQSPPRRNVYEKDKFYEKNEGFNERRHNSPGRSVDRKRGSADQYKEKSDYGSFKKNFSKMEKTLDGKKAGLQNAKNLREELASLREEEDKMFKDMDASKLGLGSEAVVRDRKTGRIKDLVKEKEESAEKMQERLVREAKYSRWGKGLKQLEEAGSKASDALHEMAKPLARYKDDNDLDAYLKAQEREGDPMLDYIRKKQEESHTVEKLKPRYEGSYGPNRFNIRPGHRWDGVDRSNGYEAKWFESINAKKAVQEEAYKWSSADM